MNNKYSSIAGLVVLYNPDLDVLDNLSSYIDQVDKLIVIDNSDIMNKILIENIQKLSKIIYICNNSNIGIAAALNIGARKAIEEGYEFLLTMDQDSSISQNLVEESLGELHKDSNIGIIAPFVVHLNNPTVPKTTGIEKITVAMTSGSIIRLSAFIQIGEYLEEFFIDYVDNEYCLRMLSAGFKVMQLNSVYVYHRLGDTRSRRFLFGIVYPTNHSATRWYYRTRNRLFVYNKYKKDFPEYVHFDKVVFIKDFIKIILYEKNKLKKMKMILLGYLDYRNNRFNNLSIHK